MDSAQQKHMKRGAIALAVIVVVGTVGSALQKYWDTLPSPPQSREIQFTKSDSMDLDHWSAVLLRAGFDKMKSQDKMPVTNVRFYVSDADTNDLALFYRKALDTPWFVKGDQNVKGLHTIVYRKMITGELRIVVIEGRVSRDNQNHVSIGSGSIIGTAEVNE